MSKYWNGPNSGLQVGRILDRANELEKEYRISSHKAEIAKESYDFAIERYEALLERVRNIRLHNYDGVAADQIRASVLSARRWCEKHEKSLEKANGRLWRARWACRGFLTETVGIEKADVSPEIHEALDKRIEEIADFAYSWA